MSTRTKLILALVALLALLIVVIVIIVDFYRYPVSTRTSETQSEQLSEAVAALPEQHENVGSWNGRLIETVKGDCRYCYVHTFEYDVSKEAADVGTLLVTVYTQEGTVQNVSVSQSAVIRGGWQAPSVEQVQEVIDNTEYGTTTQSN